MNCKFGFNSFVADCVNTTTELFHDLFGQNSLPKIVEYKSFKDDMFDSDSVLGMHQRFCGGDNGVFFNSDKKCFKTKNKLKFNSLSEKLVWWAPTGNYLQTFVHEFAHSAHFKHLRSRGNEDVLDELRETRIPTALGRFITKCSLGRYSATNMNEFMAERITKDICKNLDSNDKYEGYRSDLDYEKIFSNKWSYRYTTPQSYLDYYTQQVWNGDIDKANEIVDDMEHYLKKIETVEVHPLLSAVKVPAQKESVLSKLFNKMVEFNKALTNNLDKSNELHLRRQY